MIRAALDGAVYFGKLSAIVVLVALFVFAHPVNLLAQGRSCFMEYERFVIRAYDRLDACVVGSNHQPWYERLGTRTLCNGAYVSDALQAYGDYMSCMSVGRLWPR